MSSRDKSRSTRLLNLMIFLGIVLILAAVVFLSHICLRRLRAKVNNESLLRSRQLIAGEESPDSMMRVIDSDGGNERRRIWFMEQWRRPEYQDLAGWLSIPLLNIETPLFAKEENYWYYTEHNRFGETTADGEAGILVGNRNTIVWDHAFLDGTRFHKLANWPDSQKPLQAWLELADGDIEHYQLVQSRYITDDAFFQCDFASEEHWQDYLEQVVEWAHPEKPQSLLTIYTCHTHDAVIKSVLWFEAVDTQ